MTDFSNYGFIAPKILLPKSGFERWAVLACDQYTSEPKYWEKVEEYVGSSPSALRLILPEAYLGGAREQEKIVGIRTAMNHYLKTGVFRELEPGFVLVERWIGKKIRRGLIVAIDLEKYDFSPGACSLIRPSEGTIAERIPPRLRIRQGAPLETSHAMVLFNDPGKTFIEPLADMTTLPLLYDFELMMGAGRIRGRFVPPETPGLGEALAGLYGNMVNGMLFTVGDGNHSLATAKVYWENIRDDLPVAVREAHPARYALAELVNVHDDGLDFLPIHRVAFSTPGETVSGVIRNITEAGGKASYERASDLAEARRLAQEDTENHAIAVYSKNECGVLRIKPSHILAYGSLQPALESYGFENRVKLDYIHGDDSLISVCDSQRGTGFFMPALPKSDLFPAVTRYGVLPKKTFSMGEADEKRFYIECRAL